MKRSRRKGLTKGWSWPIGLREINADAPVHPTVKERFALAWVPQSQGSGPYRPEALKGHHAFARYYGTVQQGAADRR